MTEIYLILSFTMGVIIGTTIGIIYSNKHVKKLPDGVVAGDDVTQLNEQLISYTKELSDARAKFRSDLSKRFSSR